MRSTTNEALPGTTRDPLYPDSDGEPMGDTDYHQVAVMRLYAALEDYLAPRPRGFVAWSMLLYYQRGNPRARCSPDVLVALGAGKHPRRSFRTWEEGAVPDVVFEIASARTWPEDLGKKWATYERLRVPEYFVFDPEGPFLRPPLRGFRLERTPGFTHTLWGGNKVRWQDRAWFRNLKRHLYLRENRARRTRPPTPTAWILPTLSPTSLTRALLPSALTICSATSSSALCPPSSSASAPGKASWSSVAPRKQGCVPWA
jgi:Uma2 family endonuclease